MQSLWRNVRYGARSLQRDRGFALVAIITLALGIGATTAVFSVVNSVLLRPLPFKNPDELVFVWSRRPDNNKAPFNLPDFVDYRDQNQTLVDIAAFSNLGVSLAGAEKTERLQAMRVSASLFQVLGVNASYGRLFISEDDKPDQRHVVVLSHKCWQQRFAGETHIIGKTLNLNGEGYEVVGILPASYSLPNPDAELAIPLAPDVDPLRNVRSSVNFLRAIGRLKAGVTRSQAEADLNSIVTRQREQYGDSYSKKTGMNLVPLYEELVADVRTGLFVLLGAVVLVLLIGCSNLAALSLARAAKRHQEIAIKKAIGATSARLTVELLVESLLLAVIGGGFGILLASGGVRMILALSSTALPRYQEISVDVRALGFALAVSALCAVAFGILPAWQGAQAEINNTLRAGSRGVSDGARLNRWRSILAIGELALCFVLLIGAGLLIQSFMRVQAVQPGFDPADTMTARLSLPKSRYQNSTDVSLFANKLTQAIEVLPGIQGVGAVSILPMSGGGNTIEFSLVGHATSARDKYSAHYRLATPGYFSAMKIPLLRGRVFDQHDNGDSPPVALVNEAMARRLFPHGDVIGARLNVDDNNTGARPIEIAGVVGNVKQLNLESVEAFDIYIPMDQVHEDNVERLTNSQYWVIRSHADNPQIEKAFVAEVQKIDREAAMSNTRTLDEYLSDSVAPRRFSLRILTIFSIAALLLAVTGIYGVVSYTVTQRTPEIGIRLALGAQRTQVFRLILRHGVKVISFGLVLGLAGALALTRVLSGLLFGVTPSDPITFVFVSVTLIMITLAACSIPARRATRVDPLIALRNE